METAKIAANGRQITLPIDIRHELNIKDGDEVAFIKKDGQIILANPAKLAFEKFRNAMKSEADRLGLKDVDDVVKMVKEIRAEMYAEEQERLQQEREQ